MVTDKELAGTYRRRLLPGVRLRASHRSGLSHNHVLAAAPDKWCSQDGGDGLQETQRHSPVISSINEARAAGVQPRPATPPLVRAAAAVV